MAALALSRAYARLGTDVVWVDTGEAPAPHAALIAPPDLSTFHRLLGIDAATLVRHAAATINMGQQFAGWSGGRSEEHTPELQSLTRISYAVFRLQQKKYSSLR